MSGPPPTFLHVARALVASAFLAWVAFEVAFSLRMDHLRAIYPDGGQIALDAMMVGLLTAAIALPVTFVAVMMVQRRRR